LKRAPFIVQKTCSFAPQGVSAPPLDDERGIVPHLKTEVASAFLQLFHLWQLSSIDGDFRKA